MAGLEVHRGTETFVAPPSSRAQSRFPGRHIAAIAVLSLITVATFGYTCSLRRPWFGRLSEDLAGHQWLTASSVKFSRNWYREGAWTLRFALLENPASVEFATLASRSPYVSYPPGSVVPLYCLAQLVRQEPTPALVMGYNLANQLLIALLLSFLSYRLLTHIGLPVLDATLLSLPPPLVYLWTPACFYFHQSVFFADTAILLPFVLLLFLEALQFNRMSRTLSICQWLVFCYAYLTDWLSVFVGIVFFVYRLRFGDLSFGHGPGQLWRRCASFWSPAAIAAFAFLWQVDYLNGWSLFLARGMERAGLQPATSWSLGSFASYYFSRMIPYQLGPGANVILLAAGVGLLIVPVWAGVSRVCEYDKHARLWAIGGLSLVPCMLQILAFLNHSGHDFSALKLAIPLAVVPFSLLPGSLARLAARKSANTTAFAGVPVVLCLIFLWHSHGGGLEMCQGSPPSPRLAILGRLFAEKKIGHNDLVVSTDLEIPENPPQLLAATMKRVYLIKSVAELERLMGRVSFPYRLVLLRYQENASQWEFCDVRNEHQRIAARAAWARFVESPITGVTGTRETPQ